MTSPAMPRGVSVVTLLCDSVRQELFGKISLVGVYAGGDVVVERLPAALASLSFFQMISGLDVGAYDLEHQFRIPTHQGRRQVAIPARGQIEIVRADRPVAAVMQYQAVVFQSPGICEFTLEIRRAGTVLHREAFQFEVVAGPLSNRE